jgi:hypothetical protein
MSSCTWYRVALAWTDVSENVLSPSSGFFKTDNFHRCVTVKTLLLSLPIEWERFHDNTSVESYQLTNPQDGDSTFSETSVQAIATRHQVQEDIFNLHSSFLPPWKLPRRQNSSAIDVYVSIISEIAMGLHDLLQGYLYLFYFISGVVKTQPFLVA